MQHPDILARHHMDQLARFNVADLDEARLKGQYVRIVECKGLRVAFPLDLPVRPRAPAVSIDEEAKVRIVEEEFPVQAFNVNRPYVLLACDKIERSVGLIQEGLSLRRLQ